MVSKLPHTEGSELSSDSLNYIFTGDLVRAWSHLTLQAISTRQTHNQTTRLQETSAYLGGIVRACNSNARVGKTGGSGISNHLWLHRKCKFNLSYMRLYLKTQNQAKRKSN